MRDRARSRMIAPTEFVPDWYAIHRRSCRGGQGEIAGRPRQGRRLALPVAFGRKYVNASGERTLDRVEYLAGKEGLGKEAKGLGLLRRASGWAIVDGSGQEDGGNAVSLAAAGKQDRCHRSARSIGYRQAPVTGGSPPPMTTPSVPEAAIPATTNPDSSRHLLDIAGDKRLVLDDQDACRLASAF